MRTIRILSACILTSILTACSPVNSVAPFDDKQAAIVARAMLPPGYPVKQHQN